MRGQSTHKVSIQLLLARVASAGGSPAAQCQGAYRLELARELLEHSIYSQDRPALDSARATAQGAAADRAVLSALLPVVCQMLDYNILFRWFLDTSLEEATLDQSNFTRLRERLVGEDLAQRLFDAIVKLARAEDLLSSEHLSVGGTSIEAWAGQKSFKPNGGPPPPPDGRGGANFRGTKRTNDTCSSTTDPEAKSARKGLAKEAKVCFGGHALMENRNGLCVDIRVSSALETETAAAGKLLKRQRRKHLKPTSLGADKGYHSKAFVTFLRRKGIRSDARQSR